MKAERQRKILEIINRENIETQNQLINALADAGVRSTQATLSRDIRDMHLVKEMGPEGVYRYTVLDRTQNYDNEQRLKKIFRECVVDYAVAQNLVILKTLPGLADAACSTLDKLGLPDLMGSVAGDDTAFLAMKDPETAERFCEQIEELL